MGTERERTAIPASQAEEQQTERLPRLSLPEVCPHLGLRGDPASCALFPRPDHACGVPGAPPPPLEWQAGYCLSQRHAECLYFRAHAAGQAAELPGRTRSFRSGRRLAVAGALAAACGLLGVAFAQGYISIDVSTAEPSPAATAGMAAASPAARGGPSPAPAPTATPALSPAASPTVTPEPTLAPTATPQPTATPSPVPSPSPRPETHVVAEGETLSEIAVRYGTTVEAIMELNGLTDPNTIPAGMVLRLP